ncbi:MULTISPECIES: Scr1 family TA system antitoxin-like transcriptional regulator [Actinosynnema]|uniref:HTH cro/C1-type domain-containing protein n=1 Tax=Actinosynnema pretiosum TaxID=42197 RepID=A0A290ZAY1_9PSEU|nr:Scr1 family TA system antitoxin-like transcriptional regulator [Actinosynnema pretiosum]ATE56132.1 hypothetical protein CNX65_25010 [Actinosynnema pretiosum]MCP2098580.1 Helix-turn-helix domain-containing protein [Actinosynnema pretiosum]
MTTQDPGHDGKGGGARVSDRSPKSIAAMQDVLGRLLRAGRHNQGMSGRVAGERAGISQGKLSKLERGLARADPADVENLVALYDLPRDEGARALELAQAISVTRYRTMRSRRVWPGDLHTVKLDARSKLVRVFALTGLADLPQEVYGRKNVLLMPKWATLLPGQRNVIARAQSRRDVLVGVLPNAALTPGREVGYRIFDDTSVLVETPSGGIVLTDPGEVAVYAARFTRLSTIAFDGPDARGRSTH